MIPFADPPVLLRPIPVSFDPKEHVYMSPKGISFPGVTHILGAAAKGWMGPWMLKEAERYLKEHWKANKPYTLSARDRVIAQAKAAHTRKSADAREAGTDAHVLIEECIRAEMERTTWPMPPPDGEVFHAWQAFQSWVHDVRPRFLLAEQPVCSLLHWYAGTLDILCEIGGRFGVVDCKTSKTIYPEYFVQLAAYQRALEEHTRQPIAFRAVLRVPKDGSPYEWQEAPFTVEADFEYFSACLSIHRWNQAVRARRERGA